MYKELQKIYKEIVESSQKCVMDMKRMHNIHTKHTQKITKNTQRIHKRYKSVK